MSLEWIYMMSPDWFLVLAGCGKSSGADGLGVDSEPWVFKGGVSGEVQVCLYLTFEFHFAGYKMFLQLCNTAC